jgi:hypothetical protein
MNQEQRLAETFVELADTLVDDLGARDPPRRPATVPLPPSGRHRRHADQAVRM